MKQLLIIITMMLILVGCKKADPCENVVCQNGGGCNATGTCTCPEGYEGNFCEIRKIPTGMRVNSVVLNNYPIVNIQGGGWDSNGTGPDLYVTFDQGTTSYGENAWFKSGYYEDATPAVYTYASTGFPVTLSPTITTWVIGLWDMDSFASDEFLGGIYFTPSNYTDFPSTVDLTVGNISFTLNVSWVF
jgi:hypothetical protein